MVATAIAVLFGGTGDLFRVKPPECDPNDRVLSPFCPRAPRWLRLTMSGPASYWGTSHEKPQKYFMRFCRLHVSLLAGSAVVTMAAILWFSWQYSVFAFVKPLPVFRSTMPWTILLDMMLGIGLFLLACAIGRAKASVLYTIANLFAGAAFLAAGVFLAEYLSGRTIANFDRWWFQSIITILKEAVPGRPSPQTSVTFLFFACAFFVFHPSSSRRILAAQLITAGGLFLPLLAGLGSIFHVTPLYAGKSFLTGMAPPTLFLFVMLAFGLLSLCPTRGVVGIVTSKSLSGTTARHLLSFVIPVPVGLGWMLSYLTQKGLLSQQLAAALSVLMIIILLMILTLHLASLIRATRECPKLGNGRTRKASCRT